MLSESINILAHMRIEPTSEKEAFEPVWRALGYSISHKACYKPWLWVWSRTNGILGFRPSQIGGLNALVAIHPDLEFWRKAFPYRRDGSAVDSEKARATFVDLCFAAGEYAPPAHLKPSKGGRPRRAQT